MRSSNWGEMNSLPSFRERFSAYEAAQCPMPNADARIEQDSVVGKLDDLADAAIEGGMAGKTKAL